MTEDASVIQLAGKLATLKRADKRAAAMVAADNRKGWQLLDRAGMLALPAPVPLVQDWLQLDSLNWMAGPPQSGKSFVALDMAASIATGLPWQGLAVTRCPVLYVVAESAAGFRMRIEAWESLHGRPIDGVAIVDGAARAEGWMTFVNGAPQLTSEEDVGQLSRWAGYLRAGLIVIDTQARCTVGVDENSAMAMSTVIDSLDKLRQATGAAVLSVHHTPRNANNLRGSIAQEGAATTIITVTKDGERISVSSDMARGGKQKDMEPPPDLLLTFRPSAGSVALTKGAPVLAGSARRVLAILARRPLELGKASKSELQGLAELENVSKPSLDRALAELMERYMITREQVGRSAYFELTDLGREAS